MEHEHILHKYLNGTATASEIATLQSLSEYAAYFKIAEATSKFETPDFDEATTFETIQSQLKPAKQVKRLNPITILLRVAALFAVLAAGYIFVTSLDTSITTQVAQQEIFSLPDASEVALNSNSTLSYNKKNWKTERSLSLAGEAYFKVTKGNTFSVKTPQGIVRVLGTQFNVYVRDARFEVHCYEGLVSVAFNDTLIKLPAGNTLKVENNKLVTHTSTENVTPAWIAGESSFDNATLTSVLSELEHQYPISLTAPSNINTRRFSGSFTHSNLDKALRAICIPMQLDYSIEGDQVTLYAREGN